MYGGSLYIFLSFNNMNVITLPVVVSIELVDDCLAAIDFFFSANNRLTVCSYRFILLTFLKVQVLDWMYHSRKCNDFKIIYNKAMN